MWYEDDEERKKKMMMMINMILLFTVEIYCSIILIVSAASSTVDLSKTGCWVEKSTMGGDVAQLVESRTSTPLTQVRFPGVTRDYSPRKKSTFSAESFTCVRTPPCAIARLSI